jgi:hypothetical protein
MKDPIDHLLLKIHEDHCFGEPSEKPKITYSKVPCSFKMDNDWPDNLFDLLGSYKVKVPMKEGRIILYEDCISKFGLIFYETFGKTIGKSRQFCINLICEIVLWHELGHWITHWMPGRDKNKWNTKSYNSGSIDVHEGLAQLFTHYAIINIKDNKLRTNYLLLFSLMLQNQAPCYHKFLDILGHKKFGWNQCFTALTMIRIVEKADEATMDYFIKHLYISF